MRKDGPGREEERWKRGRQTMRKNARTVDSGGEVEGQRPGGEGIKEKRRRQNREKRKRGDGEGLRRKRGGIGSDGTEAGMRKRGGSEEPEGR